MKSPPRLIKASDAGFVPRFKYGDQAESASLCGSDDGSELGSGLVRLTKASIPWTIKYDEIIFVIEGQITVRTSGEVITANPADCIWLPAGTELVYEAESAFLFYAIHPADWASDRK